jgi:2,4-dienoyl-CoA reductase-like NADH-dependent reductase (Old Yellow Enzyme family)
MDLLASFLSPLTNVRQDYGATREARMAYPLEVFDAWPKHKFISVRISATDWLPGCVEDDDVLALARALKDHGADIIDCSAGMTTLLQSADATIASKTPAFRASVHRRPAGAESPSSSWRVDRLRRSQ